VGMIGDGCALIRGCPAVLSYTQSERENQETLSQRADIDRHGLWGISVLARDGRAYCKR